MKGIYKYTDLMTGDVVYVGKDSHIDKNQRYREHLQPSKYYKQAFNRILQNNRDRYEYSVLYCSDDVSDGDLNMLEMSFIERYNPKFNFTKGGEGTVGFKQSKETRIKISESRKGKYGGENHPNYGNHLSEKTRIKLSEAHNTTGYYKVKKRKEKTCKQGFIWLYRYYVDGKEKTISSVDIKKLEKKVKAKGLEWRRIR